MPDRYYCGPVFCLSPKGECLDTEYILDLFVKTQPGEAYRLFPFGTIYKGGKKRVIDAEYAAKFKLPHFKPPIKLGSHGETTPGGGTIIGLEVREDGLYAVPEYTEKGQKTLDEGDYRYHSPEVIWEGGGLEDPSTGKVIEGPLIVGDAMLHTPHLGEAAALYTYERMEADMPDEIVQVPGTIWEKFTALIEKLTAAPEPPAPIVVEETDEFRAAAQERDQYKMQLDQLKSEQAKAAEKAALVADLQNKEKFGTMWIALDKAEEAAGMLGTMGPEQRDWVMRTFSALNGQIQTSELYGEKGTSGAGAEADPMSALDAAIRAKMSEKQVLYNEALGMIRADHPEMFDAAYRRKE